MTKQNPAPPVLVDPVTKLTALSRANSLAVAGFAALSLLPAAFMRDWSTFGWCSVALILGLLEWQGQREYRTGRRMGLLGMVASQLILIAAIWLYAWIRWRNFDADTMWGQFPGFVRQLLENRMIASGLDPYYDRPFLMYLTNVMLCVCLALVSLIYQGGLAIHYVVKDRAMRRTASANTPSTPPLVHR